MFNFDPNPKFSPKNTFFIFFRLVIIDRDVQCVELTEFSGNIFNMPIFKPKVNF